jgi:2-polyprenyl-3-methyl-5-hydroxy-6-metoxy-1,4-benzoquinol methylase
MRLIASAKRQVKPLLPQWLLRWVAANGDGTPGSSIHSFGPEDTVIADFAEFSDQSVPQVIEGLHQYRQLVQGEWQKLGASSFAEASTRFYAQSQSYVFDVLSGNYNRNMVIEKLNRFGPGILASIKQHPGKAFLEFGGGVGVFCEVAAGFGKDVTYLDIPGRISDFAAWRFKKYNLPIRTIIVEPGNDLKRLESYDVIYTDAVLEHMPPAEQLRVTKILGTLLRPAGVLVFLVDLGGPTPENPTHEVVDIDLLHSTLSDLGLHCQEGKGNFWSIWRRH